MNKLPETKGNELVSPYLKLPIRSIAEVADELKHRQGANKRIGRETDTVANLSKK